MRARTYCQAAVFIIDSANFFRARAKRKTGGTGLPPPICSDARRSILAWLGRVRQTFRPARSTSRAGGTRRQGSPERTGRFPPAGGAETRGDPSVAHRARPYPQKSVKASPSGPGPATGAKVPAPSATRCDPVRPGAPDRDPGPLSSGASNRGRDHLVQGRKGPSSRSSGACCGGVRARPASRRSLQALRLSVPEPTARTQGPGHRVAPKCECMRRAPRWRGPATNADTTPQSPILPAAARQWAGHPARPLHLGRNTPGRAGV